MAQLVVLLVAALGASGVGAAGARRFPPWFRFGAATSAHQVEGAWNVSGKSPSMWDTFVHASSSINGDGDVACDSYHLWRQDVQIATDLGLDYYRFSISWPRLLPSGFPDRVNPAGVRYYSELIDALLASGIEPAVTLYHWDLPQSLLDLGGWTNPLIVEWFVDYARVAFSLFGARVRTWLTLNEPLIYCELSYAAGVHAPGVRSAGRGDYLCARHAMLAHARAWRLYDEEFRPLYNGRISLTNQIIWIEAEHPGDEELAELARQANAGVYSHPIYSQAGGWPPALERHLQLTRNKTGYPATVLPRFTKQEIKMIRGTFDFYGLNYYTARYVRRGAGGAGRVGARPVDGVPELRVDLGHHPDWFADHPWFYWFVDYARVAFSLFGARVRTWLTLNEPLIYCELSYAAGVHAPGVRSAGRGDYLCARHAMLAHARAWRLYDEEFRPLYNGRISLTNQIIWIEAEHPGDEELAELARQANAGVYSHPIYSQAGGWPPALERHLQLTRNKTGYPATVLPRFTKQEIKMIRGTFDFYGLNYYTARYVRRGAGGAGRVGARPVDGVPELRVDLGHHPDWFADHPWFYIYPAGLRKLLNWLQGQYGDLEFIIFENGLMQRDTGLYDPRRIQTYRDHLEQVLLAMEDGVNVTAFTAWTMIDNFEWTDGYDYSFGLYSVDFSDPRRRRTPRASARYYAHVIQNRTLEPPEDYSRYASSAPVICAGLLPAAALMMMMVEELIS